MKKKLVLGLIILIMALLLAVFSIDAKHYNNFVARKIEKIARQNGIQLAIGTLVLNTNTIRTNQIQLSTILSNGLPLMLSIKQLEFITNWLGLFQAQLSNRIILNLYSGTLTGETYSKLLSNDHNLKFQLLDLNLAEHPQILGFGIISANLSITEAEASFSRHNLASLTGTISLSNFEKAGETILSPDLTGLPLPLNIPPINDLNLRALIKADTSMLELADIQSKSSWGSFSGGIEFSKDSGRLSLSQASIDVVLSPSGSQLLGPFLPLLSSAKLNSETTVFKLIDKNGVLVAVP